MLRWLCRDRGLCAVVGLPLWSGSLVAIVLIVVAAVTLQPPRCSQMLAGRRPHRCERAAKPAASGPGSAAPTADLLANVSEQRFSDLLEAQPARLGRTDLPRCAPSAEIGGARSRQPPRRGAHHRRRARPMVVCHAGPDAQSADPLRRALVQDPLLLAAPAGARASSRRRCGDCCPAAPAPTTAGSCSRGRSPGRWPAIAASHGCAISLEVMPWILPFLHVTREVNGWQDLWLPLDGALDPETTSQRLGDGGQASPARGSSGYDLQVRCVADHLEALCAQRPVS